MKTDRISNFNEYEKATREALTLYNEQKYSDSLELFLKMADYNYDNPSLHEKLAYNYLALNDLDHAIQEYQILIRMAKKRNITIEINSFEDLIHDIGDSSELLRDCQLILREKKSGHTTCEMKKILNMGFIKMAQKKFVEAEKLLTRIARTFQQAS